MSKVVLGKGLQALIPSEERATGENHQVHTLALSRLKPNPFQPRRDFDHDSLQELADSFQRNGIMQPLVIRQQGSEFTIIAGERRFRAAHLAGLTEVPVLIMDDVDDVQMLELALVENLQRENLNPLETADAYRMLIDKCDLTQGQLANRLGKSRVSITNLLRLLGLPASIQNMLREGRLTEGHARALLAIDSEAEMLRLADRIISESWTVREAERRTKKTKGRKLIPKRKLPALADAENRLKQALGTSVKIVPGLKRGRIEIEYYSNDDLDRLLEILLTTNG